VNNVHIEASRASHEEGKIELPPRKPCRVPIGCTKRIGVSPSSAFRHYADKRALLTAFATRALNQLLSAMDSAREHASANGSNAFLAVGLAYIEFGLQKPAFFRAMWREETIYVNDEDYRQAASQLSARLKSGFASAIDDDDPDAFSPEELLAWSCVHGLASLFVDGPVARGKSIEHRLQMAKSMLRAASPAFDAQSSSTG